MKSILPENNRLQSYFILCAEEKEKAFFLPVHMGIHPVSGKLVLLQLSVTLPQGEKLKGMRLFDYKLLQQIFESISSDQQQEFLLSFFTPLLEQLYLLLPQKGFVHVQLFDSRSGKNSYYQRNGRDPEMSFKINAESTDSIGTYFLQRHFPGYAFTAIKHGLRYNRDAEKREKIERMYRSIIEKRFQWIEKIEESFPRTLSFAELRSIVNGVQALNGEVFIRAKIEKIKLEHLRQKEVLLQDIESYTHYKNLFPYVQKRSLQC